MEVAMARSDGAAFSSPLATTLKRPGEGDPSDNVARAVGAVLSSASIPRRTLEDAASSLLNLPPSETPQAAWSPGEVDKLEREFPSPWNAQPTPLQELSQERQLHMLCYMQHSAPVKASAWSSDGRFLATVTALGTVHIFDSRTFRSALVNVHVQAFRDTNETEIDEFYRVKFTPDNSKVLVAGSRKSRRTFDAVDRENKVLPSAIKVFDCATGKCLARFEGHLEEIHCLKIVPFRGNTYLLTGSEDGFLIKWKLNQDFTAYEKQSFFGDKTAQMVFSVSFLPNCGNKYFLAAIDDGLRLYDFEFRQLLQSFPGLYGSFCDYVKFVPLRIDDDYADQLATLKPTKKRNKPAPKPPKPPPTLNEDLKTEDLSASIGTSSATSSANTPNPVPGSPKIIERIKPKRARRKKLNQREYLLITRGAELIDREDPNKMLRPNAVHLRKLISPKCGAKGEAVPHDWNVELVHPFEHRQYIANEWPLKCAVTDRYIFCPTGDGKVFIWSLLTGDLIASLADHVRDIPVRHISVNPIHPWIATSSDDHYCVIYTDEQIDRDEEGNIVDSKQTKALDSNFDVSSLFADVPTNPPPARFTPQLRAPPQRFTSASSSVPQIPYQPQRPAQTQTYPGFPPAGSFYPGFPFGPQMIAMNVPPIQLVPARQPLPIPPSKVKEDRIKAKQARISKLQQEGAAANAALAAKTLSSSTNPLSEPLAKPHFPAPMPAPVTSSPSESTPRSPVPKPSRPSTPNNPSSQSLTPLQPISPKPSSTPTVSQPQSQPQPRPSGNPSSFAPPLPRDPPAQSPVPHPMAMAQAPSVVGMPPGYQFPMMQTMPTMPLSFAQQITSQLPAGTDPRMIEIINTLAATAALSQQQLAINAMSNPFNYYGQLQKMMQLYPQYMSQMPQVMQMPQMPQMTQMARMAQIPQMAQMTQMAQMQLPQMAQMQMPQMAPVMPSWPVLAVDPNALAVLQQQQRAPLGFAPAPTFPGSYSNMSHFPPSSSQDGAKK